MNNNIALIFGATGQLGREITNELSKLNTTLILVGKNQEKLKQINEDIKNNLKKNITLVSTDLSHTRSIEKLGNEIFKRFGKLDVLINCTSFFPKLSPINHITPKDFNKIVNINIIASWNIIRSFDPLLKLSKQGRAYFMICKKYKKKPYFSSYNLANSAIETLISTWQEENNKSNLKVEAYDPGIFASPLRSQTFPGENKNKIMTANKAAKIFIKNYKNNY